MGARTGLVLRLREQEWGLEAGQARWREMDSVRCKWQEVLETEPTRCADGYGDRKGIQVQGFDLNNPVGNLTPPGGRLVRDMLSWRTHSWRRREEQGNPGFFQDSGKETSGENELHRAQAALLSVLLELRAQAALAFPNVGPITIFTNSPGF